jgi:hypothetical protein
MRTHTSRAHAIGLGLAAAATACSGPSVDLRQSAELAAARAAGYRIAVTPFAVSAPEDGFLIDALAPLGEVVALEPGAQGLPPREQLGIIMRRSVAAWLAMGPFQVMELWASDTRLAHAGLSLADMNDRSRARWMCEELGVDGILFGDVTRWNRSYYVIESAATVGLEAELVDGHTGKSLFVSQRSERVGTGLSGGPTGIVAAATSPLAGLKSSTVAELGRNVARDTAADLNGVPVELAPDEAGRGDAPSFLFYALVRTHERAYRPGERVEVVAVCSPSCEVRFDIGRFRTDIPMVEVDRVDDERGARATFSGHYIVQEGERIGRAPVFLTLRKHGAKEVRAKYRVPGEVTIGG